MIAAVTIPAPAIAAPTTMAVRCVSSVRRSISRISLRGTVTRSKQPLLRRRRPRGDGRHLQGQRIRPGVDDEARQHPCVAVAE